MMRLLRLAPALVYMGIIFYLSSQEAPAVGVSDKLLHVLAFGALAMMLVFGLAGSMPPTWVAVVSATVSILYGVSDEVHQYFVPGRSAEVMDAVADAGGSILAALLYFWIGRMWRRAPTPVRLSGPSELGKERGPAH